MANDAQLAQRWLSGMQQSGEKMKQGADAVTESPGVRANRAKEKYRARVMASLDDGTYEAGNASYGLSDWKTAYTTKGIARVSSGATAALPRVQRYIAAARPIWEQSKEQCAQMPNDNDAQALEKVRVNMENMKKIKQTYRRR